jgi:hypothetical protein
MKGRYERESEIEKQNSLFCIGLTLIRWSALKVR